ncbi:hypothetical protein V8D89_012857, partial [Ganoderma adspersum]
MDTPRSEKTHIEARSSYVDKASKAAKPFSAETSVSPSIYETGGIIEVEADVPDVPPDGGRGWVVLFGCMIFSAAISGWGYVWGVTEEYLKSNVFPDASESVLSTLGSIGGMFMTLLSVVPGKLADRYGYKPFLALGGVLWTISMLACAFATELWHFFLIMGPVQGISLALVYPLIVALPAQWFLKYRALATSMVVAGSSLGGAISTLVFRVMLTSLGLRRSFLIYTAIDGVLLFAAWFMIAERRKPTQRKEIIWFDKSFFADPVFWSLGGCLFFTIFGYLSPIFFLPTFTRQKLPNLPPLLTVLPITMLSFSSSIGRPLLGFAADRIGPVNTLWIAIMLSGLTQLLVWTFVSTYAGIIAFGIMYGFVCGCFLSLSSAVAAQLYGSGRLAGLSGLLLLFNLPG